MSTLTRICTRPIVKIEMDLTFELNDEKVVILEEDLLYKVKYIAPVNSGDSISPIKEFVGRLAKIIPTDEKGFNPFYNGTVYNLVFDISEEFNSIEIKLSTAQIRDIDLYIKEEENENNADEDNGNDETVNGDSGELGSDSTESGDDESQSNNGGEDQGSTGEDDGTDEPVGDGDTPTSGSDVEDEGETPTGPEVEDETLTE